MTNVIQALYTANDFAAALNRRWIVKPEESTSKELDKSVTRERGSEVSTPVYSSTSSWLEENVKLKGFIQQFMPYGQDFFSEKPEEVESGVTFLFAGSADFSIPVVDNLSKNLDASTAKNEVHRLFSLATFIDLEPGMANEFSEGLEQVIERHGTKALDAIKRLILDDETASSIAMEALKYIGNFDSNSWHDDRRLMLEDCLRRSHSAWIRDGAGLGLSFLDNPRSIPAIERAITKETSKALKEDLMLVLNQLQRTLGA